MDRRSIRCHLLSHKHNEASLAQVRSRATYIWQSIYHLQQVFSCCAIVCAERKRKRNDKFNYIKSSWHCNPFLYVNVHATVRQLSGSCLSYPQHITVHFVLLLYFTLFPNNSFCLFGCSALRFVSFRFVWLLFEN